MRTRPAACWRRRSCCWRAAHTVEKKNADCRMALSGGAGGGRGGDDSCAGQFCARIRLCLRFDGCGRSGSGCFALRCIRRVYAGAGLLAMPHCPWNGAGACTCRCETGGRRLVAAGGAAERVCDGRLAGTVGSVVYLRDCVDALRAGDAARRHGGACPRAGRGQAVRAAAWRCFCLFTAGIRLCREVGAHEAAWKAQTHKNRNSGAERGETR